MITQKRSKNDLSITNVMVNNMDPGLSKNDAPKMRAYFSQFGPIVTATVHVTDSNFYGPKTVFVEFQNEEDATNCVNFYKKNKVIHYLGGLPIAAKFSYRHSDPKNKKPKNPASNDNINNKNKSNISTNGNVLSQFQQQQQLASLQLQNMYLFPQAFQQVNTPYIAPNGAFQLPQNLALVNSLVPNFYLIDDPQYSQYNMDPTVLANYSTMMTNNLLSQMMINNTAGFVPLNSVPGSNSLMQSQQMLASQCVNEENNEKLVQDTM